MWARMLDIFKYVWHNPIVQFACFTVVEGVYIILRKKTGRNYSQYHLEKNDNNTSSINEAVSDLIIDNNTKNEKEVVAEEAKSKKESKKKKEVILEDKPKAKKTRKRSIDNLDNSANESTDKPKRKRTVKRVAVKKIEETSTEEKSN